MCGIVGIIGQRNDNVAKNTLSMLKKLEYRGYDSAGIAIVKNDVENPNGSDVEFEIIKSIGSIENLEKKIPADFASPMAIAHSRWATHGEVNELNAHPHLAEDGSIVLVHNGIIENYGELKKFLQNRGFSFYSNTDTEIIPNLISYNLSFTSNFREALGKSLKQLKGSYAIALMTKNEPHKLFVVKNNSPLVIGLGSGWNSAASSLVAFPTSIEHIILLEDGDMAEIAANGVQIFNLDGEIMTRKTIDIKINEDETDKRGFPHHMLKEIYEQPEVLKRTISEYVDKNRLETNFSKFNLDFSKIERLTVVACGTSYHAGCVAKYFIEKMAGISVDVDIASEFRYRASPVGKNSLAIFISQSGETADTLAALKYCKNRGQKILSLVNVPQSAMAAASDMVLKTIAGTEIGVASTKAFVAQIALLYLLSVELAKQRGKITIDAYQEEIKNFVNAVKVAEQSLEKNRVEKIKELSKTIAKAPSLLYMGRGILYPIAMEGALKIKEISYIPTQAVASGELKHGTLALVDSDSYVVVISNSAVLYDKNISSVEEVLARGGKIIMIGDTHEGLAAEDIFAFLETPKTGNTFEILLASLLSVQLLAYYTSLARGIDVDKPRNLAKSVTVE